MLIQQLATYTGLPETEIERLLALSPVEIYDDPAYLALIPQLDEETLKASAAHVQQIYGEQLPSLKDKHRLGGTIMSSYTLVNWVLGFLMYPERLRDMLHYHQRLSTEQVAGMLPELFALLDDLPEGRDAWKTALAVISLPLLANGD